MGGLDRHKLPVNDTVGDATNKWSEKPDMDIQVLYTRTD